MLCAFIGITFSSKCKRSKVKIRKKVTLAMRCPHEVIVAAFDETPQVQEEIKLVEAVCKFCKKTFDANSGGRCTDCKNGVVYCSKKCQV